MKARFIKPFKLDTPSGPMTINVGDEWNLTRTTDGSAVIVMGHGIQQKVPEEYFELPDRKVKESKTMKLTKARLKQMIKEELTRAKLLSERTIADVAAEQGVGPGEDDGPLDEMATFQQVARDKGVNPDDDAEWKRTISFKKWFKKLDANPRFGHEDFKLDPGGRREVPSSTRSGGTRSSSETYYDFSVTFDAAKKAEWPDDLAANWKIRWSAYYSEYIIKTDIRSDLGVRGRDLD